MSYIKITAEQLKTILAELNTLSGVLQSVSGSTPVEPTPVEVPDAVAFSHNGINFYRAKTLSGAKAGFQSTYGSASKDNDNIDGYWYSASKNFNGASDLPSSIIGTAPTTPVVTPPVTTPVPPSGAEYTSSKYKPGDLISMHFDSSMDPDDLQAMIANKCMLDNVGYVNYITINGTRSWENTEIIKGSTEHCRSLFSNTLDSHANWSGTVATVSAMWNATLNNGGTVWVAEGGPSDFTADCLRKVAADKRGKVVVVQHSAGTTAFNEMKTKPDNMAFVKANVEYTPVGNGNTGGTSWGRKSPKFKDENKGTWFANAYKTKYGDQWRWAESEIYKDNLLDFSDSVELVYILGLTGKITDYNDFYTNYMK